MEILTRRLAAIGIDVTQHQPSSVTGITGGCPVLHQSAAPAVATAAADPAAGGCPMHVAASSSSSSAAASLDGGSSVDGAAGSSIAKTIMDFAVQYSMADGGRVDVATLKDQLATFFAAGHDTTGEGKVAKGWLNSFPPPFAALHTTTKAPPESTYNPTTLYTHVTKILPPAALVAWTVNFLCRNPDVEAKLAAEVREVLGENGDDPSWQQLNEMKYMTAVLKESLRLRPPGEFGYLC
jgi:hypothetical protein